MDLRLSLVWSGRIPEKEKVTFIDDTEVQQHVVVRSLISIVDKQEHARRKRFWNRGFSTAALKDYESLVIKRTLQLVEVLSSKNMKEIIDLTTWIKFFRYAAMSSLALAQIKLLHYSYDAMTDIACVKPIYRQKQ